MIFFTVRKVYRKKAISIRDYKDEKKPGASLFSKWLVGLLLGIKQKTRGYIVPSNDKDI